MRTYETGHKMTAWEGGTKSPSFIHSPNPNLIPEVVKILLLGPGVAYITKL